MSRLTNEIRNDICDALMARKFEGRDEAIAKMIADLGDKAYKEVYPAPIRKKMAGFPEGAFAEFKSMKIAFGGERRSFSFEAYRLFFHAHGAGWSEIESFKGDHPLTTLHREISKQERNLASERDAVKHQIMAALRSANTVKQLRDTWPEVAPFLPAEERAAALPAIPFDTLNKSLGLPVSA